MGEKLEALAAAETLLEDAEKAILEARHVLRFHPNPAQRERLFRLLSGVVANCEIIKQGIKR